MNFKSIRISENEISDIISSYSNSIIMVVLPSCITKLKKGSFRVALIYHKYKKVYCGEVDNVNSSNKCAIYGLIEAANHITKPMDVVFITASYFGFKKAVKYEGVNQELWNQFFSVLEKIGCKNITEVVAIGGGWQIASICRD